MSAASFAAVRKEWYEAIQKTLCSIGAKPERASIHAGSVQAGYCAVPTGTRLSRQLCGELKPAGRSQAYVCRSGKSLHSKQDGAEATLCFLYAFNRLPINTMSMILRLHTRTGRLRLLGFLEGISLLLLVFVAVPAKYFFHSPSLVKALGPVHGAIFLLFLFQVLSMGVEQRWTFRHTTWKVILACFIPFGTFYIDRKILSKL